MTNNKVLTIVTGKGIGGDVSEDNGELYVVRFYAGVECISRKIVRASSEDMAIAFVLRYTIERYDDGLTYVDVCLASNAYNSTGRDILARTQYEIEYLDTKTIRINGYTFDTDYLPIHDQPACPSCGTIHYMQEGDLCVQCESILNGDTTLR